LIKFPPRNLLHFLRNVNKLEDIIIYLKFICMCMGVINREPCRSAP